MTPAKIPDTSAPSVFFYVQHLLGIGHLARASRIAGALAADGMAVTLVTGGRPVPGFPGPGVAHVALPPLAVSDGAFAGLVDGEGNPASESYLADRAALLLAAFHAAKPDIVITEAFPFGRRRVRFELLPLIEAIEATTPRPKLVASLRDILQERGRPDRDRETVEVVRAHYDLVMVHGDPAFAALGASFPFAAEIADRVAYTGLVAGPKPVPSEERFDVVVSAGGGAVGAGLVTAALEAARTLPEVAAWLVITGPNLPQVYVDRMAATAPPNVTLTRFRTDFGQVLAAARLSVSQAGYNTVGDVLQAGCAAILVPYATLGETEQADRAARLGAMGRATVIPEAALSAASLAGAVQNALAGADRSSTGAQTPSLAAGALDVDGAGRSARILRQLHDNVPVTAGLPLP